MNDTLTPLILLSALQVDVLHIGYGLEQPIYPFTNEIAVRDMANYLRLRTQVEDFYMETGVPQPAHEWMTMQSTADLRVEVLYGPAGDDHQPSDNIAINGVRKGDKAFIAFQERPYKLCSGNIRLYQSDGIAMAQNMVSLIPGLTRGRRGPFYFDNRPSPANYLDTGEIPVPDFDAIPTVQSGFAQIRHGHRAEYLLDETAKTVCWCEKGDDDGAYILRPTEIEPAGKAELTNEINRHLVTLVAEIREHRNWQ